MLQKYSQNFVEKVGKNRTSSAKQLPASPNKQKVKRK